jgi:hypothetical protein
VAQAFDLARISNTVDAPLLRSLAGWPALCSWVPVKTTTTEAAPVFAVFEEPALSQAEGPGISAGVPAPFSPIPGARSMGFKPLTPTSRVGWTLKLHTSVRTLLQGQNVPRGTYLQMFLVKHIADSTPTIAAPFGMKV